MNNFEMPFAIGEMMIENSLKAVKALNTVAEYNEKMARTALDNGKNAREMGMKMVQQWAEMTRENTRHFGGAVEKAVATGTQAYKTQVEAFMPKVSQN